MKRTSKIVLVLLGAASTSACDHSGGDLIRNRYQSLQDCTADYNAAQCQPAGGYGGGYYGPSYYRSNYSGDARDPGPGRSGRAVSTEVVNRGGFGASAGSFARGG